MLTALFAVSWNWLLPVNSLGTLWLPEGVTPQQPVPAHSKQHIVESVGTLPADDGLWVTVSLRQGRVGPSRLRRFFRLTGPASGGRSRFPWSHWVVRRVALAT